MPTKAKAKPSKLEKEVLQTMATTPKRKVNFKDATKPAFELLEPQVIDPVKLIKYKFGESKSGNEKVTFEFQRDDGEGKQHFWKDYLIGEEYIWRLREALSELDCDPQYLEDKDADIEEAVKSVMGTMCALKIGIGDPYENKDGEIITNNVVEAVMRS